MRIYGLLAMTLLWLIFFLLVTVFYNEYLQVIDRIFLYSGQVFLFGATVFFGITAYKERELF